MRPNAWPGSTYPLFGDAEAKYEQKEKRLIQKKNLPLAQMQVADFSS